MKIAIPISVKTGCCKLGIYLFSCLTTYIYDYCTCTIRVLTGNQSPHSQAPPSLAGPDLPCGSGPARLGPTITVRLTASDEKLGVDHHNTVKLPGNIVQGIIIYIVQWIVPRVHRTWMVPKDHQVQYPG